MIVVVLPFVLTLYSIDSIETAPCCYAGTYLVLAAVLVFWCHPGLPVMMLLFVRCVAMTFLESVLAAAMALRCSGAIK